MKGYGIAIIGMALNFPKASSPEEFWENIHGGRNCIENLTDAELLAAGVSEEQLQSPDYVKVKGGTMDSPYDFDTGLFNYTESEARAMEPQMRIFHEVVWKALENAGYDPRRVPGSVGVYAGAAPNLYWQYLNIAGEDDSISSQVTLDNLVSTNYLPTRVSYNFGFEGPSVFMYTACSTSLVTIHMACRALLGGECDVAVAGGSSILGDTSKGYTYEDGMILSPDGQCRAFDQKAQGTIPGEGVGVIVLKPLAAALSDGDNILGVIRSSAINNDGKRKVGYSAPSIYAQADVIRTAMAIGDIAPGEMSYIETHGTGTLLGDSVEIEGLKIAMESMNGNKKCVLGSLKPNIGHLDSASGIAGIIKVILAMKNKTLPPTINCDAPISGLADEESMFTILSEPATWENGDFPLVAGVSSFGIGGTNAHVILEEPPKRNTVALPEGALGEDVVLLSERSPIALDQLSRELVECVVKESVSFESLVYTLKTGRHSFPWRRLLLGSGLNDVKEGLLHGSYRDNSPAGKRSRVAFVFSGLETESTILGKDLYTHSYHFKNILDKCFRIIEEKSGIELNRIFDKNRNCGTDLHTTLIRFCVAISLADTLKVYGILPELVAGEHLGELAAAYTAGMFSLEDLVSLLLRSLLPSTHTAEISIPSNIKAPQIIVISSMTGEPIHATHGSYWENKVDWRSSPLFTEKARQSLCAQNNTTILEFGHKGNLASLIQESIRADFDQEMLNPLIPQKEGLSERTALNYALGVLWLKGWDIEWASSYARIKVNKAVLPGIKFDRKEYSIHMDQIHLRQDANSFLDNQKSSGVLNTLFWKQKNETGIDAGGENEAGWLIFCDDLGIGEQLAGKLENGSGPPILVKDGEAFKALDDNSFVIRHGVLDDYQAMFSQLAERNQTPSRILHCFSLTARSEQTGKEFAEEQNRGMYSLLNIAKSLKAFEQSNKTVINIITENLYRLCDETRTFPGTATLMGPMKVIPQEYPFLVCRNIDIDTFGPWKNAKRDTTLALIGHELLQAVENPVVAIRGRRKWIQDFQELKLPEAVNETSIRKKGTYIIIGGLGDVGFSFASLLASKYEANLIIAGKSSLGESYYTGPFTNGRFDPTRMDRLNKLKEYGTNIQYLSLDVADDKGVWKFFDEVKSKYGKYDGIIYAAGTVSGPGIQFIDSLKQNDCENQFLTKVYGVMNVTRALEEHKPELCLFISSIASLLGGMEYAAYAGANAFVDSYILEQNYQHNMKWKVIDWDGMSSRESMEEFERIASVKGLEQIFVSAGGNLKGRLSRWIDLQEPEEDAPVLLDHSGEVRNRLSSEYEAPEGEMEKRLVKIWQRFFGIADIGVKDSFFELGGDSLKALTFLSSVHKELHVKISIKDFYRNLTIRQLVRVIEGHKGEEYIPMKKAEEKELYKLTPGQKRMYVLWKLNKGSIAYNQTYILQVKGALDVERLLQALSKLASRHDAFRTSVAELGRETIYESHPPPVDCL